MTPRLQLLGEGCERQAWWELSALEKGNMGVRQQFQTREASPSLESWRFGAVMPASPQDTFNAANFAVLC